MRAALVSGLLLAGAAGAREAENRLDPSVAQGAADTDAALLDALSWAFERLPVDVRVLAVEDLGLLGDPRALNALGQLATDLNPRIQLAAVRALRLIRHPRAAQILLNLTLHPSLPEVTRERALEGLLVQNQPESLAALREIGLGQIRTRNLDARARALLAPSSPQAPPP